MELPDRLHEALGSSYSLERELGRGGTAIVYLARDLRHNRYVALKVLHPEVAAAVSVERFLSEIDLVAQLTHPHILPLLDSGRAGTLPYYTMPFVRGESLRERMARERQLPMDDAIRIAAEVADALDYAHASGVIHRDVKPENILLSGRHALLADFGIGKAVRAATRRELTVTGLTLGTPAYMSPEQAAGEAQIDGRSDIFSLGAVLYEMIAGVPPFTGASAQAVIAKRFVEPPPPLRSQQCSIPEWVEAAILRALALSPEDRFSSATEFATSVAGSAGSWVMTPRSPTRVPAAPRRRSDAFASGTRAVGPAGEPPSIAVLPFENMSSDRENEYFSDGVTEEIINALCHVRSVRVAARTSAFAFKGRRSDLRTVGEQLNVRNVLEGTVRRSGNRLRVTAHLTNVAEGYSLWSEHYDRELRDVFAVQDEIAAAIVDALQITLLRPPRRPSGKRRTDNLAAYELYLKGRYHWNQRGLAPVQQALAYFQQAVNTDPSYAIAHAGISDCFLVLTNWSYLVPREGYESARAAARKAVEIDESLAEGHTSLASVLCSYDWDWPEADRHFRRALELNPRLANAHYAYALCLAAHARFAEALLEATRARELDPLNRSVVGGVGRVHYLARRYAQATEALRAALDLEPDFASTHVWLALALLEQGDHAGAVAESATARRLAGEVPLFVALDGYIAARLGEQERARGALDVLLAHPIGAAYHVAEVYLGLGENEQAAEWLERACEERSEGLVLFAVGPMLDPLRSDPRIENLLARCGAPSAHAIRWTGAVAI